MEDGSCERKRQKKLLKGRLCCEESVTFVKLLSVRRTRWKRKCSGCEDWNDHRHVTHSRTALRRFNIRNFIVLYGKHCIFTLIGVNASSFNEISDKHQVKQLLIEGAQKSILNIAFMPAFMPSRSYYTYFLKQRLSFGTLVQTSPLWYKLEKSQNQVNFPVTSNMDAKTERPQHYCCIWRKSA